MICKRSARGGFRCIAYNYIQGGFLLSSADDGSRVLSLAGVNGPVTASTSAERRKVITGRIRRHSDRETGCVARNVSPQRSRLGVDIGQPVLDDIEDADDPEQQTVVRERYLPDLVHVHELQEQSHGLADVAGHHPSRARDAR
jgi:hypothetical protein